MMNSTSVDQIIGMSFRYKANLYEMVHDYVCYQHDYLSKHYHEKIDADKCETYALQMLKTKYEGESCRENKKKN